MQTVPLHRKGSVIPLRSPREGAWDPRHSRRGYYLTRIRTPVLLDKPKRMPQRMTIRENVENATVSYPPFSCLHTHTRARRASSYDRFARNYTIRLLARGKTRDSKRFQEDSVLKRSANLERLSTARKQGGNLILRAGHAILILSVFFFFWRDDLCSQIFFFLLVVGSENCYPHLC